MDKRQTKTFDARRTSRFVICFFAALLLFLGITPSARAETSTGIEPLSSAASLADATTLDSMVDNDALPVCLIARVTASMELTGDQNVYQLNSEDNEIAQENVLSLCETVLDNEDVSVTLAISPLLLQDWYTLQNADDATSYKEVIGSLQAAWETGRLELVQTGYGDPSFSLLSSLNCPTDIATHYQVARSSLAFGFSDGTCPIDLSLPQGAASLLGEQSITWTAVDASLLDVAGNPVTSGIYTCSEDQDISLVGIDTQNAALFLQEDASQVSALLDGYASRVPGADYATVIEIGTEKDAGAALSKTLAAIALEDNITLKTVSEAVASANSDPLSLPQDATVASATADNNISGRFLADFTTAHESVSALGSILYSASTTYDQAERCLLLSEFGGFNDEETTASVLIQEANSLSNSMLDNIDITVERMVLAGESGNIPVIVTNNTDAAYEITLTFTPGENLQIGDAYKDGVTLIIYSGENYLQIPVTVSSKQSTLTVAIASEERTLVQETTIIKTSHINEITVIIGGIILVVGTAVYIRHKRRKKEEENNTTAHDNGDKHNTGEVS